jgi:hypothetical protein
MVVEPCPVGQLDGGLTRGDAQVVEYGHGME